MVDSPRYTRTGDGSGKMEAKTVAGDRLQAETRDGRRKREAKTSYIYDIRFTLFDLRFTGFQP